MNKMLSTGLLTVSGLALGAAAFYFLDPNKSRRRINEAKDKLSSGLDDVSHNWRTSANDLGNRARGLASDLTSQFQGKDVSDDVLAKRIHSKLGHVVLYPRDLDLTVVEGRVTLSGRVFEQEISKLDRAIRLIPGVKDFVNNLEMRLDSDQYDRLHSERGMTNQGMAYLQRNWKPATKILTGAAGGALLIGGLWKGGVTGKTLLGFGVPLLTGLFAESSNKTFSGADQIKNVDVSRDITINAPVDQVFSFFANFQNFPNFMRHIREVRDMGDGRSHWVVHGPAGANVEFDSIITRFEEDQNLSWRTTGDNMVENAGALLFDEMGDGRTRVRVKMTVTPPGGILGQAVATIFGANPKRELEEDLNRAKTFIETGTPAKDAAKKADAQQISQQNLDSASADISGLSEGSDTIRTDLGRSAS